MSMPSSKKRKTLPVGQGGAEEEWLVLNLSGTRLMAKRATLVSVKESMLARMFDPDSPFGFQHDDSGAILLERDAEAFQWILGVLRRGGAVLSPPPQILADRIRNEADYFGLDGIVQAIDYHCQAVQQQYIVEQKIVTKTMNYEEEYGDEDTWKVEPGWVVKSITCSDVKGGRLMRTALLERIIFAPDPAYLQFRVDGRPKDFVPASFGSDLRPLSGLAVPTVPSNMTGDENDPLLLNADELSGKVAFTRSGGSSFLEKARLAESAGAVALVVRQTEDRKLEMMDAPPGDGAVDIRIPVLMTTMDYVTDGSIIELCTGGPRR